MEKIQNFSLEENTLIITRKENTTEECSIIKNEINSHRNTEHIKPTSIYNKNTIDFNSSSVNLKELFSLCFSKKQLIATNKSTILNNSSGISKSLKKKKLSDHFNSLVSKIKYKVNIAQKFIIERKEINSTNNNTNENDVINTLNIFNFDLNSLYELQIINEDGFNSDFNKTVILINQNLPLPMSNSILNSYLLDYHNDFNTNDFNYISELSNVNPHFTKDIEKEALNDCVNIKQFFSKEIISFYHLMKINSQELLIRKNLFLFIKNSIELMSPDFSVSLFGSIEYGLGAASSDIDLNLIISDNFIKNNSWGVNNLSDKELFESIKAKLLSSFKNTNSNRDIDNEQQSYSVKEIEIIYSKYCSIISGEIEVKFKCPLDAKYNCIVKFDIAVNRRETEQAKAHKSNVIKNNKGIEIVYFFFKYLLKSRGLSKASSGGLSGDVLFNLLNTFLCVYYYIKGEKHIRDIVMFIIDFLRFFVREFNYLSLGINVNKEGGISFYSRKDKIKSYSGQILSCYNHVLPNLDIGVVGKRYILVLVLFQEVLGFLEIIFKEYLKESIFSNVFFEVEDKYFKFASSSIDEEIKKNKYFEFGILNKIIIFNEKIGNRRCFYYDLYNNK